MDEWLRFVARLLEGDKVAVLCREFGISRKTGYKLYRRHWDIGLSGHIDIVPSRSLVTLRRTAFCNT